MCLKDRNRRYQDRLKERAQALIGSRCVFCGSEEQLHAAHVAITQLSRAGPGRGKKRRFKDVVQNLDAYRAMCAKCHRTFDALTEKLVDSLLALKNSEENSPIPF